MGCYVDVQTLFFVATSTYEHLLGCYVDVQTLSLETWDVYFDFDVMRKFFWERREQIRGTYMVRFMVDVDVNQRVGRRRTDAMFRMDNSML